MCELLSPVDSAQALSLVQDPRYCMQIKEDGFRLVIETDMITGQRAGYDRKGQPTAIPEEVLAQLGPVGPVDDSIYDGELVFDRDGRARFVAWDIMRWMGTDTREMSYVERLALLENEGVEVVATWWGEDKVAALVSLHDAGAEGVCFKDSLAVWQPGRAQQHFKLKFWESATCRVADKSLRADAREDKHSAALDLLDADGRWQEMGFVTIPSGQELPAIGTLGEVRYLYAQVDGLYQPLWLGARTDVDEDECTVAQLKWKAARADYLPTGER